ncbi:myopalladin isoform X1 [Pantherophis guttatus]|uniref:Myopalladin n=1 Tax=Pantherophis guttatus TaxID=94885 RepID=A0A6P9DGC2_PANGU|nr:myopalladin isoform X1 [Pantherophis guttatus]XP_034294559.1 myopalladin isoform X1 [Pantherophis guttatus]
MQDNTSESSTSITQLLRESYLAENSHQGNSERSRSESSLHSVHSGSTSRASDEVTGQDELPDLSAFLSQEELDESVNLARQAINQEPPENSQEEEQQIHVFLPSELKNSENIISKKKQFPSTASPTSGNHPKKQQPFGSETESKKELLNKAADFIEELSSLFKAHSSKKIRPRTCKNYRSKLDSKHKANQDNSSENRERPCVPISQESDQIQPSLENPAYPQQADVEVVHTLENPELSTDTSVAPFYSEEPIGQPPHFTQKLKSREVSEGTKVQLDCIVVGIPTPEIRWYCEGKELENSPYIQIIQSGELHSLIIVEAFEEDTGRYSCFASNIYGTDSTSAEIYVEGASSSESESDNSKEEMDRYQNQTKTSPAAPPPAPLPPAPLLANSSATHQEAIQPQPLMKHPVSVPVYQNQSPTNYLQGLDGRPLIAAPVFTKMLQNISASEGQLVVFECRVKGAPSPKVEWYREGTLIEDSPDFRILQKKPRSMAEPEEICTLVIAEVFSEDSGSFTCTASNKYGTVSSSAHLIVKGPVDQTSNAALHTISSLNLVASEHQPSASTPSFSLVDNPPKPKLESVLVNHNEPRSSSKIGLRVHFKLPEDEKGSETSSEDGSGLKNQARPNSFPNKINGQAFKLQEPSSPSKEPPPLLAKPKLDATQLKQLHNQVLFEQQQIHQPSHPVPPESLFNTGPGKSATLPIQHQHQKQPASATHKQNKVPSTQTFTYTRPKQFLASQNTSAASSPSSSSVSSFSNVPQGTQKTTKKENLLVSPPPAQSRSPGRLTNQMEQLLPSPREHVLPPLLLSVSNMNQFQPQNVLPTPLSPTGRIQNPVAFLSAVLPALPSTPPTNAMGLPKCAPAMGSHGMLKKNLNPLQSSTEDAMKDHKAAVMKGLEKRLHLWNDESFHSQQKTAYDENLAHGLQGPSPHSPTFNFTAEEVSQEYKISNFEQRLMNEIEFRLERTPVDESDDEIQHDEIPTGKCIAPIFDKRLKHFRVPEGYPATFTCKIVGIPVPKVYWFKDGKQISKKNGHFKMIRDEDGTCSLHIEATTNDDDGNYTFMAANPQGRISCSGRLMVQTPTLRSRLSTPIQSHRGRSRVSERDREPLQERFFRPYFLQAPGDMVAHEGRLCRLDCKVSGLPPPELMWLRNGKPVLPDVTHKMLVRENGVHSLLIDPLRQNDAGIYTCVATNKTGQNSFSLELSVVEKEVKKAPVILERLQNCGVPEGHPVRLECRVIGMPPPIFFWKKDNETIPPHRERMSMHQDATGYVCLLIQPAKKVDAGWYTLSAKNEAGIVSCTARLDIYAQWHHQISQPIKFRSSSTRYAHLMGQGLDIFSAFSAVENPARFSSPSQPVVESEEL